MKLTWNNYWVIALCLFAVQSFAQTSCTYTLRLEDSFGDTWNGAFLQVQLNDDISNYALREQQERSKDFPLLVATGDSISISFVSGTFDEEISYALIDPSGTTIFERAIQHTTEVVFSDILNCPACLEVPFESFMPEDVRATTATLSWLQSNDANTYWVQYGLAGFDRTLDTAFITSTIDTNSIALFNLQPLTRYDIYVSSICATGDTLQEDTPFTFKTVGFVDVGIVDITRPVTGCDIGASDTLEVTIKNFGTRPQTLIPFNFIINNVPGSVNQPLDGVFAGVLSKDSTFTIEFDARVDVATPNVYEIIAYTELEGDMNAANDTFRMEIINIPNIIEYPYFTDFEDWSSGWRPAENSRNSSWEFGRPSLGVNTAASGENAWMTALNSTYNASERSYLISPCLDFTSLEEDPVLSFSLFLDTESCCDEAWIESSVDGGDTWSKVIENEPSLNWYNDQQAQQWDGTTGLPGWVPVMNRLIGTAGEAEVLLRIVFSSDASTQRAGIGVDNIFISEPLENDMATVRVAHTSLEECGETEDEVQLEIVNLGQNVQRGFEVYYQINGGAVITEQINVPVAPLETLTYTFEQTFSSNAFNRYTITAGVIGLDDELEFNNLAKTTITNIYRIPFVEDFESRRLPEGWTTSEENNIVTIGHNAPSFVASDLLFSGDNFFEFDSPTFGTVTAMDSFSFAYRFVNFDTPGEVTDLARMLAPGDSLLVLISTDCGENYLPFYTVDRDNHMPSETMQTVRLSLADFSGQNVKFRFRTYRGALGEFYIDLDNISIKRCPANLDLVANIINVSTIEQPDGQITVRPRQGLPPYYYVWSTQDSTPTITNLVAGRYTVTVTDAVGCSDVLEASVSVLTEVMELDPLKQVNIAPNPTAGNSQLSVELHEVAEVNVRVFNSVGQQVKTYPRQRTQQLQQTIDLTGYENGLYFVQLWVNGRPYTKRLVVIQY